MLEDKLLRHVSTMLRTMYFLPVLISMTVVALLFSFVYHPKIGLINAGLKMIGLGNLAHAWTGATDTAIFSAIAMSQWHSMGYTMMLFIVAHSGHSGGSLRGGRDRRRGAFVSLHQRHAAAGEGNDLRYVRDDGYRRVPGLQRRVYPHRRPGPGNASTTLAVYMYKNGFALDKMGYASTIAVGMLIISMILALIQNRAFGSGKED